MPERRKVYYFDTVTLSNFALAGRFDVLIMRYGERLLLTLEVLDELAEGVIAGYGPLREIEKAVEDGRIKRAEASMSSSARQTYRELLRVLGPGEASCIAHASGCKGVVVSDDRAARLCCTEKGIAVTGTIGILKACCIDGSITEKEADGILHAMIAAGFYSPIRCMGECPEFSSQ
jgi:predicted nucleic acid-binding protein